MIVYDDIKELKNHSVGEFGLRDVDTTQEGSRA